MVDWKRAPDSCVERRSLATFQRKCGLSVKERSTMRMGGMVSLPPLPCQWPDDPLGWPRSAPERKETCMSETRGWTVPSGIGGWLYLVAVGLCLTPVRLVLEIGPSVYSALGGSLVLVLVWVPYLCRSQRVANTFMR